MEQKNHLKVKSLGFFNESMMLRTNDSQNLKRVNEYRLSWILEIYRLDSKRGSMEHGNHA